MRISLASIAACVVSVNCLTIDIHKRDTPLKVELTPLDNSKVNAALTNTAAEGLNLFYRGSFLDGDAPVDKFVVHGTDSRARFNGVLLRLSTTNLSTTNFVPIEAGQTIETVIDVAELYDVETSDSYDIRAVGSMPYTALNSTTLSGKSVAFSSNTITMDIDGDEAARVPYAVNTISKRTDLETNSCSASRVKVIRRAEDNCAALASNAASAAAAGYRLNDFFNTRSASAAKTISARFAAVANDCGSTSSRATTTSCGDAYHYCSEGVLAYTLPSNNHIAYCDLFYSLLPGLSTQCGDQDQATTMLHEETHAPAVYSPGTEDYAYGPEAASDLTAHEAINNADSYAIYANALYAGC